MDCLLKQSARPLRGEGIPSQYIVVVPVQATSVGLKLSIDLDI